MTAFALAVKRQPVKHQLSNINVKPKIISVGEVRRTDFPTGFAASVSCDMLDT